MSQNEVIAGIVRATCTCCEAPRLLLNHVQLGAARMHCPATQRTYLDRGDGVFRDDGAMLAPAALATPQLPSVSPPTAAELLDDRPARTHDKTRIQLERATFA
jgi:hypothetical protein